MKLTIEGTSEEISNVLLTILNSKKRTVSETFFSTISGHRDNPGLVGEAGELTVDGKAVSHALADQRPQKRTYDQSFKSEKDGTIVTATLSNDELLIHLNSNDGIGTFVLKKQRN